MLKYIIIGIVALIFVSYIIGTRNDFDKLRRAIKQQGSNIGIKISKRTSCLNDAIAIVKSQYKAEIEGIEKLTASQQMEQLKYLGSSLYPNLQSNQGYQITLHEAMELDKEISASRELLDGNIRAYNDAISSFPALILAKIFGFKEEKFIDEDNYEANKTLDKRDVDLTNF